MDKLIRNNGYLKKQFPDFYSRVMSPELFNPELQVAEYGEDNLIVQNAQCRCFLHSTYDVEREMDELFKGCSSDPDQILLILGLGMGHCLEYIRKHRIKYRRIVVLEPYNNIFRKLLEKKDVAELTNMKDVSITIFRDARSIAHEIMNFSLSSRNTRLMFHMSYRSLYDEIFEEICRLFVGEKRAFLTSTATLDHFIQAWAQNQVKSILREEPSSTVFYKKFANIPALIISAGPSLEKHLDQIRGIGNKALLIAPGTGAKICTKQDIPAHLAVAMDSDFEEAELFQDCSIKVLIGSYRLHPEVDRVYPHSIFRMINGNDNIAKYYYQYNDWPVEIINDHASVSTSAIDYAVRLGCNPIILVGQDMCFYENRFHAGEEVNSLDTSVKARFMETKDINGQLVYTDIPFLSLQRDMEITNLQYQGICNIINASEAGLGIPGVENMKLAEVIERYIKPQKTDVSAIVEEVLNDMDSDIVGTSGNTKEFYDHMQEELQRLEELNLGKKKELDKLEAMINKGLKDNRLTSQLYFIREKNDQLQASSLYTTVVVPMIAHFMSFYQAGVMYEFNEVNDPRAWLWYEKHYFDYSDRYIKLVQNMLEKALNDKAEEIVDSFNAGGLILPFSV